jgi:hypothetical protein
VTSHTRPWRLRQLTQPLCIVRLDPEAPEPDWAWDGAELVSVTRTPDELSIVCPEELAHDAEDVAGPYVCYVVDERLDFMLTGVLAGLLEPLADDGISNLVLSTYETDWILVPADQAGSAAAAWRRRGHTVV